MTDRRSATEIRQEMAGVREQLGTAVSELRESVRARRKRAGLAGGVAAAGVATATVLRIRRRLRRQDRRP